MSFCLLTFALLQIRWKGVEDGSVSGETHTSCVCRQCIPYHKLEPQALGSVFEILVYFPLSCSVAIDNQEVQVTVLALIEMMFIYLFIYSFF